MDKRVFLDYALYFLILVEISLFVFMVYNGFESDVLNDSNENSNISEEKGLTGKAILIESSESKITIYAVFLVIIAIAIFFIARERNIEDEEVKKPRK